MGLLPGIVIGTMVGECVMLPVRMWLVHDLFTRRVRMGYLGPLLRFGLPLVPASIAYWVFTVSDRLVLARLRSLSEVGLYSAANAVVGVLALLERGGRPGMVSSRLSNSTRATARWRRDSLATVLLALLVVNGLLSVFVSTFAAELLRVLSTAAFVRAAPAIPALALALVAIGPHPR